MRRRFAAICFAVALAIAAYAIIADWLFLLWLTLILASVGLFLLSKERVGLVSKTSKVLLIVVVLGLVLFGILALVWLAIWS